MPRNDILRNDNKVFATASHPSLRDTFSPRAKALMWLHLCLYERRLYGTLPGDCHGATNTVASRNDIIVQRAFYNDASAGMFRLHFVPFNMT